MKNRIDVAEVACWRLSLRCNRSCRFCLSSSGPGRPQSHHEPEPVLRRLSALGFKKVSYTGGEPLLHPQLPEILEVGDRLGLAQVVTTNGDALFGRPIPEWLHFVEHVRLSFYGDEPQHEALMGTGHYRSSLQLATDLHNAGVSVSANYMLSSPSMERVSEFLVDAHRAELHHVVLQSYIEVGRTRVDEAFRLERPDTAFARVTGLVANAPRFDGGVRIHDFTRNDWLIVLDERGRLTLPSNGGEPDHILGNLFADDLTPLHGLETAPARDVLESVWSTHRSPGPVRKLQLTTDQA